MITDKQNFTPLYNSNSDNELVNIFRLKNDSAAFETIVDRHKPLVYSIIDKYATYITGYHKQDLYQDNLSIIHEAVKTFKSDKNTQLSTWIGEITKFTCLDLIRKTAVKDFKNVDIDTIFNLKDNSEEKLHFKELKEYIASILDQLDDKRIKKIFEMRVFNDRGFQWKDVAAEIKCSKQTAQTLFKNGKAIIKEKLKSGQINDNV